MDTGLRGSRRDRQCVELRLTDARQREVRRRGLRRFNGAAVIDQRVEFLRVIVRQTLDGRGVEHLAAETPAQRQLAAVDLAFDRQPVAQRRRWILRHAVAFGGRHEHRGIVELTVELPQIVEGDARLRQRRQFGANRRCAEVTQRAIAQAFVRHGTQLFLDGFDRRAEIARRHQIDREQAGEPTDGAGQVDVVEQVFAAMAFKLDQRAALPAPAANRPRQRGQQQVVDLGAIGRRGLLQQFAGLFGVEFEFEFVFEAVFQRAVWAVARQIVRCVVQLGLPVTEAVFKGWKMILQASDPALIACWFSPATRCRRCRTAEGLPATRARKHRPPPGDE